MGGYGGGFQPQQQQQNPWNRTAIHGTPGSTQDNPTARPNFSGQGFFNQQAYGGTPWGQQQNPYGSFFQTPQYGGSFSPFGSTTGRAFNRGGNSSTYRPGGGFGGFGGFGGYGGLYQQQNPFQPQAFHGGYGQQQQGGYGQGASPQFNQAFQFGGQPLQQQGGYGGHNPFMRFGQQGIGGGYRSGGLGPYRRAVMRF